MKVVHVVGGAIRRGERVLAALRSSQMSLPGVWEFPGGKVEPGESPEESLRRELDEELGVTVVVGALIARGVIETDARRIELDVYWCSLAVGEPRAKEHAELRWLGLEALRDVDWAQADLPAVDRIERVLAVSSSD